MAHNRRGRQDLQGFARRDQSDGRVSPRQFMERHHFLKAILVVSPAAVDGLAPIAGKTAARIPLGWSEVMAHGAGRGAAPHVARLRDELVSWCDAHGVAPEPETWLHEHILETVAIAEPASIRGSFLMLYGDLEPPPIRAVAPAVEPWDGQEPLQTWRGRIDALLEHADSVGQGLEENEDFISLSSGGLRRGRYQQLHEETAAGLARWVHVHFLWAAARYLDAQEWIYENADQVDERTLREATDKVLRRLGLPLGE